MAIYACSDLHGNWELWLEIKKFLKPEDKMFFLGDAADRGDSGWTILKEMLNDKRITYIAGNHDIMLADRISNPNNYDNNIFTNKSYNISTQSEVIKTKKVPQPYQHSINAGELQQRRYQKALKKIMIEQLKNKSINIPSICSCGQLQRKIDSLLNEGKSITPNDLMNVDCANNCIYYQKPGEYHKALSDIIQSMRNLNFENPYNK